MAISGVRDRAAEIVFNSDLVVDGAPVSLDSGRHGALGGAYGVFWMPPSTIAGLGGIHAIHRDTAMHEEIVAGRGADGTAELGIEVGAYRLETAYSGRTGARLEAQENSGSVPGSSALGVPSTEIETTLTLDKSP